MSSSPTLQSLSISVFLGLWLVKCVEEVTGGEWPPVTTQAEQGLPMESRQKGQCVLGGLSS